MAQYYNLCHHWGDIAEDGYCNFHRPRRWWHPSPHVCIPPRDYLSRRGIVRRRPRFPKWSPKSWRHAPPARWWRDQHRRARAIQRREMLHYAEDPVIPPDRKLIDLWGWY